jgi:threonine/homoserine/homoserine lactone efflux protein
VRCERAQRVAPSLRDTRSVLETLIAFLAVAAVVICTPGQDTALTIRNTVGGGRRAGVATAGGVALGQAIWTLAASAGVVAVLSASEPAFRALKLAGAAYLVYLGVQSLLAALGRRRHDREPSDAAPLAPARALRQGAISNLGNPKMAVFFASCCRSSPAARQRRSSRSSRSGSSSAR